VPWALNNLDVHEKRTQLHPERALNVVVNPLLVATPLASFLKQA
jgi:hypothetical protein